MFSGNFLVDQEVPSAEFSMEYVSDLFESKAKSPPVRLDHMTIFSKRQVTIKRADREYSVSLRGYIHGKRTSMSVWMEWLGQELLWTPLSDVGISDDFQADCNRCEDEDPDWFVLGRYGTRKQFQVLCTALYFDTTIDIDIPASSSSGYDDILQLVQKTFMDSIDREGAVTFESKGCTFVLVVCDGLQLAAASPGSTLCVTLQGFIQCRKTDLQLWPKWFEARWSVARNGLFNLSEFETARSESSTWVPIYRFGTLGENNECRSAAKQARFVPSRA